MNYGPFYSHKRDECGRLIPCPPGHPCECRDKILALDEATSPQPVKRPAVEEFGEIGKRLRELEVEREKSSAHYD